MFMVRVDPESQRKGKNDVGKEANVEEDDARVEFSTGNPNVEVTRGTVHLYRSLKDSHDESKGHGMPSQQLLALAVPRHVTVADFCDYCSSFLSKITAMRILRRSISDDSYMVLMTLDSEKSAHLFYSQYNGKQYTTLEPGIWSLVWVSSVEITDVESSASLPPSGQTELPNCPVCLERLDQHISGVVTTVCNHAFHSQCLRQWADASCPVCRYCDNEQATSYCSECGTSTGLWMCLICGHIGCGRYHQQHAVEHWKSTQHCYSMELESQKVWDYVGDNYVHRIIQSKTDGKLVELPSPHYGPAATSSGEDKVFEEALLSSKVEAIALEYNTLLTIQLESQRQYYEGLLATAALEAELGNEAALNAERAAAVAREAVHSAKKSEKESKHAKKKLGALEEECAALKYEKQTLETLNKQLTDNQQYLKGMLEEKAKEWQVLEQKMRGEIAELEEQVRDLMVFVEAREKISRGNNELSHDAKGGQLYLGEGACASSPRQRLREKIKQTRR